ncbi:MAG: hypothetical protein DI598_10150 [Pseudopedobacter saltans]|uniref:Uncharacterized protein n=1 Tax=Pseudopedobacter saltans TaxID=151895 RepID=A0A2W5GR60_9SPHI|nr:MAG: hypothetical protein DI598_10150 [Pseudopedobacter saltans]
MIETPIEIPLSKKKMTLSFLGALAFVVIGLWFIVKPPYISNPLLGNPIVLFIIGLASVIFFGIIAIINIRKFFDKRAGLIIDKDGIWDNSSGVSAGLVAWSDIRQIKVTQIMSQRFIILIVDNPQTYIERVKNPLKRKTMDFNYKSYGSPISISANSLNTNFDKLYNLLMEKKRESKSTHSTNKH